MEKKKKVLTKGICHSIIFKLSRNAAIAQPVERILGKDEVASSNLASSSILDRNLRISIFFMLFFKLYFHTLCINLLQWLLGWLQMIHLKLDPKMLLSSGN